MAVDDAAAGGAPGGSSKSDDDVRVPADTAERDDTIRRAAVPRTFVGPTGRSKKNRTPVYLVVGVIVVAVGVAGFLIGNGGNSGTNSKAKPAPTNFVAFRDASTGVSISYPSSWTALPKSDPTVRLLVTAGGAGNLDSFEVRVQQTSAVVGTSSTSIADLRAVTDAIVSGSPVTVLPQYPRPVTINSVPGYYYLYTLTDAPSGQQLVHAHYFLFEGHDMVSMVFQTVSADFARLAATFDQVTASLHIGLPTTTTPSTG